MIKENIMKRKIEPYYVIVWNFNKDQIDKYNIMDYLIECYQETKKSKKLITPQTFEECKKFIESKSIYMFWSRCEYECIVHGFPIRQHKYKLDVSIYTMNLILDEAIRKEKERIDKLIDMEIERRMKEN